MAHRKYIISLGQFLMFGLTIAVIGCTKAGSPSSPSTVTLQGPQTQHTGGVDGGGGNHVRSNPDQIKRIFDGSSGFDLKKAVKSTFKVIEFAVSQKYPSAKLTSLFSVMLGPQFYGDSFSVYEDIDVTPYNLQDVGPCIDKNGGNQDAGTTIDEKKSPICFSLERLSDLPIQAIPAQLVALAVHEHSHHYGYNEKDAVEAQNYVLELINQKLMISHFVDLMSSAASIRDSSTVLVNALNGAVSSEQICRRLGWLEQEVDQLATLGDVADNDVEGKLLSQAFEGQGKIDSNALKGIGDLKKTINGAADYCGSDNFTGQRGSRLQPVAKGDQKALKDSLSVIYSMSNQIIQQLSASAHF